METYMNQENKWIAKVFEENGDIGFLIPVNIVEILNLKIDELVELEKINNDELVIRKTNIIHSTEEKV
jgi:hypothetical protein